MVTGDAGPTEGDAAAAGTHNAWDFLIVAVVIGGLVALTVFLVRHYTKVSDIAQILGIAVPGFAAAFGITLGYATGNTTGKATGKEQGKQETKNIVTPKLDEIAKEAARLVTPLRVHAVNPEGSDAWQLEKNFASEPLALEPEAFDLPDKIDNLRSLIAQL
jgi:hypothetical protein